MARFARRRLRVVLVAAVLLAALAPLWMWLRDAPFARVEHARITGIHGPQASEIRVALTAAAQDMTTLHVRGDALRTATESYSVVHSIETDADFPHTLNIAVNAYEPVAVLQSAGQSAAVSADGMILRGSSTRGLALIRVGAVPSADRVGDAALLRSLRLLAAAPPALRARVERLVNSGRNLIAVLTNGPKLYFGTGGRRIAKWAAAARVLADGGSRAAGYIDLRLPERPVAGGLPPPSDNSSTSTLG